MREDLVRGVGLTVVIAYTAFIGWLYVRQPQTAADVTGGISASIGAYRVNQQAFEDGRLLFGRDEFVAARTAFARADPAHQDARTQFYVAYSYYRQGWGRLYQDDALFRQGLEALNRAIAVAPGGRIVVDDPALQIHTGDELAAEFEAGMRRDVSDFNPLRILRSRK